MIKFIRDGSKLSIHVSSWMGYTYVHEVNYQISAYAHLIKIQLEKELDSKLESIRREAYNEGWKDAKSKKVQKKTWFKSIW